MSTELSTVVLPDGEIIPGRGLPAERVNERYPVMVCQPFSEEERGILLGRIDPLQVKIRPDGIVYLPASRYQECLDRAFLPGAWALAPRTPWAERDGVVYREYDLYIHGHWRSEGMGAMRYQPNNPDMTWADCCEGATSEALRRCCKRLGMFREIHEIDWRENWKKEYAIAVWRKPKDGKKNKPEWRRKDAGPFWDEVGLVKKGESQQVLPNPPYTDPPPKMEEGPTPEQFRENSATMRKGFVGEMTAIFQEPITPPLKERANALCDKMQAYREGLTEDDLKECQLNWSGLKQRLWPKKELVPETVETVEPEKEINF